MFVGWIAQSLTFELGQISCKAKNTIRMFIIDKGEFIYELTLIAICCKQLNSKVWFMYMKKLLRYKLGASTKRKNK